MKVILIAAITADGFIAKSTDHLADWTSQEDKKHFMSVTKEAGVLIIGRKTYDTIGRALPGRKNIIMTRTKADIEGIETTSETPIELISRLDSEGYDSVCVCGGRQIYTAFAEAGLIDELQLTIEPIVFGSGIQLFDAELNLELNLTAEQKLNDATILLTYEVKK